MMGKLICELDEGRIIFMSMYIDIAWGDPQNENAFLVADYARRFPFGHWSFFGPGSEKKSNGTDIYKPCGQWDRVVEIVMINFSESGHPIIRSNSAFVRRILKSKGGVENYP